MRMEEYWFVVVFSIVWHSSTHGLPAHGGYETPVKRSDYSMYDNQFFSVGDTPLDNEVTDCAVVRHQYARGYIRLREYLERMQGCGTAGKQKNVAGIAAATKDTDSLTSDGFRIPSNNVVHVAPFKPRPIGQLIDNIDKKQEQVKAYNNQVKNLQVQLPFQQHGIQRSHQNHPSFNNLGFFTQANGALSYKKNFDTHKAVLPVARKIISRKNLNTNQQKPFNRLNNARSRQQYYMSPDPQRYYSMKTAEDKHAYNGPIAVGQPILRPNPLAFHQQSSTGSKVGIPQADQPVNPDLNMDKPLSQKQQMNAQAGNRHDAVPVKPVWQGRGDNIQDDLEGQDDVKDEANEIGSLKSDPIPSEAAFTENPKLEDEGHETEQKMDDNGKDLQHVRTQETKADMSTHQPQTSTLNVGNGNPKPSTPRNKAGTHDNVEDDMENSEQNESNKLDEFLKPSTNSNDETEGRNSASLSIDNKDGNAFAKEEEKSSASSKNRGDDNGGIAINLDVLKDKISSSKDIGFLRRMLTLIKKITHHKDFHKLAGAQKDAIMQAGKAVTSVVSRGPNTQRSFIQPRPSNASPNTNMAYYRSGVQSTNSYISPHPPSWKVGDRTLTGSTQAQFYQGRQTQISKKFQIERNPYYQQPRRVSYTPPYFSLQRLNYGIYNGNVP